MRKLRLSVLGVALAACLVGELVYRHEHSTTSSSDSWVAATTKTIQASATKPLQQGTPGNQVPASAVQKTGKSTGVLDEHQPTKSSTATATAQKAMPQTPQSLTAPSKSQVVGAGVTAPSSTKHATTVTAQVHSTSSAHTMGTTSVKSSPSPTASKTGSTQPTGGEGSASSAPDLGSFTISVSEDNGQTQLKQLTVKIVQGESLIQYMHQYFQVQTIDGDDFVVGINGIMSQWTGVPIAKRQPVDWFLYVNGKQAPVGAATIYPHQGDVDLWDYHRWDPSSGN